MFEKLLRFAGFAIGLASAAFLSGCAANGTAASPSSGTRTVMIGQGGSYSIPDLSPSQDIAPYALTGSREMANAPDLAGVYQNYGQSQVVIPPAR
jgi:hypothetical protein